MKTNNVVNLENYKAQKTVNLFLTKTKEIDRKLQNFLEDKNERSKRDGYKA